jgi:hypothetical protein
MEWLLALLKSEWTAEDFIPTSQNQKLENHELVEVCQVVDSEEGELEEELSKEESSTSYDSKDSRGESMSEESEDSGESLEEETSEEEQDTLFNKIHTKRALYPAANNVTQGIFFKKFKRDQLNLWIRLRTQASKFHALTVPVEAWCVDGEIKRGEIDLLQDTKGYSRRFCTWVNALWVYDGYSECLRCNEFFHEALLSYSIRTTLHDLPMFSRAAIMVANVSKRTLGFKKVLGGVDMDKELYKMTCSQLHSCIAQVLVGLRIAQSRMNLKHHDLHLGNIMVSPRTESGEFQIETPEGPVKIPLVGYDATIIDFGLSSLSQEKSLVRLDIDLLIQGGSQLSHSTSRVTSDIGKSWGTWDPDLTGDTGYDFSMFIESVTETVLEERPLNLDKITMLAKLQELITTEFTERCRPQHPSLIDWSKVWNILELVH